MHWKKAQGCIRSVKNSGKLNLDPHLYQTLHFSRFLGQGIYFRPQKLCRGNF